MKALLHVDLIVRDLDRSLRFYRDGLDLPVVEDQRQEGRLAEFMSGGHATSYRMVLLQVAPFKRSLGGLIELLQFYPPLPEEAVRFGSGPQGPLPSMINLSLFVEQLAPTLESLRAVGAEPVSEEFQIKLPNLGSSRMVFVRDPDGHLLELVST